MIPNPIPAPVRGRFYVGAVVLGGLAVVAGPTMAALEVPAPWVAVVTSLIGAVTALLGTLARDNLELPGGATPSEPEPEPVDEYTGPTTRAAIRKSLEEERLQREHEDLTQ